MGVGLACGGSAGTHHLGVFFGHNVPMRFVPGCFLLLALAFSIAGCGSEEQAVAEDPEPSAPIQTTSPATPTTEDVEPTPETTAPPTTEPQTTSTSTESTVPEPQGLDVVVEADREVLVTSVIVADDDGKLLATVFDPDSLGCEGFPADYFAVVGPDGAVSSSAVGEQQRQYAGAVTVSPNRRQLLEVRSCEGFLSAITIYDIGSSLDLTNPVGIDITDAMSGDASWNADGFITMILSSQPAQFGDPDAEGEPEIIVNEYLVNPRTGESTLFGTLEEFHYGVIRTPDGTRIYSDWGIEPAVVLVPRGSTDERRFSAGGFSLSPDSSQLALWDSIFDSGDGGRIELLDTDTGFTTTISQGRALRVVWNDNSTRLAFSAGNETLVHDLGTGETVSVGTAEPENCDDDAYITWGRVPLAFTPAGDLYVGDPVCVVSSEGFPSIEYRLRQLSLS